MASVLSQNLFDLLSDDQPTEVSAPAKTQPAPSKPAPVKEKVDRKDQSVRNKGRGGKGRGGKREFDRRSGTGRVDGEKKEIAGKGSWGNPTETPE
jgi:plasminogen activator inhibitor 1 RNA-binding protein